MVAFSESGTQHPLAVVGASRESFGRAELKSCWASAATLGCSGPLSIDFLVFQMRMWAGLCEQRTKLQHTAGPWSLLTSHTSSLDYGKGLEACLVMDLKNPKKLRQEG